MQRHASVSNSWRAPRQANACIRGVPQRSPANAAHIAAAAKPQTIYALHTTDMDEATRLPNGAMETKSPPPLVSTILGSWNTKVHEPARSLSPRAGHVNRPTRARGAG